MIEFMFAHMSLDALIPRDYACFQVLPCEKQSCLPNIQRSDSLPFLVYLAVGTGGSQPAKLPSFGGYSLKTLTPYPTGGTTTQSLP